MAGLVTLESGWKPPLGDTLIKNLLTRQKEHTLDLGCVAAHGIFARQDDDSYLIEENGMAATAFLFELIARLQVLATVPMIDIRAYAAWLKA